MALLLAVSTWTAERPGTAAAGETDEASRVLSAAGWRVATVTADTPLGVAWDMLNRTHMIRGAPTAPGPAIGPEPGRGAPGGGNGTPAASTATPPAGADEPMNTRLTVAAALATVLASIALYPLLAGGTWFWGGIGVVIVVAAVGAATRRRPIPAILCVAAAVGAEFLYLNAVFAGRQSWAGLVPTGASVRHLQVLLHQAMTETSKYAPPVPPRPGIVLLTVAGIGLVGVLTDVLAVRLHRPALAGLPLLVLFCVPLTTDARPGAVGGTLVFCAGMVGYLGLLSADGRHRLRLWGRLIHPWQDDGDSLGPDVRPLAAAGRRIGSAAVVIALALPLLVPGLKAHRLFAGEGTGKGSGGSHGRISFPKPLDLLNTDLRETRPVPVLSYHTPDGTPPYLQVYVLGNLTTNAWTMGSVPATTALTRRGFMPAVPGVARTAASSAWPSVHEWITLGKNLASRGNVNYLPLPYAARQVKVGGGGDWRVDGNTLSVLSPNARLAGLHYQVIAKDVNPLPQQLRHSAQRGGFIQRVSQRPAPVPDEEDHEAGEADHQKQYHRLRQGSGDPGLVHRRRSLQVHAEGAVDAEPLRPDPVPDQVQGGVLPAVRLRDGRAGATGGHSVPRRRGLHPGLLHRERQLAGEDQRRARLAGTLLPHRRLAALRADPAEPGRAARAGHGLTSALFDTALRPADHQPGDRPAGQH